MKQTVDTIIEARWMICCDEQNRIIEQAAIAVDQGKICAIGTQAEISQSFDGKHKETLDHHILIPGLVNCHTHAAMTLLRGYADDLPLMTWLTEHIWPAEQKHVNPAFIETGTQLAIAEMLLSGTTTFNDMYFYPEITANIAEQVGIRANIGMIVIDQETVWAKNIDEYLQKGLHIHDQYRHSHLITTSFAPHAPYSVGDDAFRRIATLSEELDCQIHLHLHETQSEIDMSMAQYQMRPIERLDQLGLLSHRLMAVHMAQLLPGEIEILERLGVHIVHCPQSNLKLASGICDTDKLAKADINVAIGTDSAASNNDLDMLEEMRLAALLAKGHSMDPEALPAEHALKMATINGAKALGLDDQIGSLEIGKQADIVAIDYDHPSMTPLYHPLSHIVYSGSGQVSDVWISGKQQLKQRQLTQLDRFDIQSKARSIAEKIAQT